MFQSTQVVRQFRKMDDVVINALEEIETDSVSGDVDEVRDDMDTAKDGVDVAMDDVDSVKDGVDVAMDDVDSVRGRRRLYQGKKWTRSRTAWTLQWTT